MIQVTDRELLGSIHIHHWLKPQQEYSGPLLEEMMGSVVMYYPDTSEVVVDTPTGESYVMCVDNADIVSKIIKRGEINLGFSYNVGTCRWIKYDHEDDVQEELSMYVGDGLWLTESSKYVWFYNIESLLEVDVEISQTV